MLPWWVGSVDGVGSLVVLKGAPESALAGLDDEPEVTAASRGNGKIKPSAAAKGSIDGMFDDAALEYFM